MIIKGLDVALRFLWLGGKPDKIASVFPPETAQGGYSCLTEGISYG